MTTHTKRDLRAADMLGLILFGFGVVLALFAVMKMTGKVEARGGSLIGQWIIAGVFMMLGMVLNLKVRQLVRTKGVEPTDYEGVPDHGSPADPSDVEPSATPE